MLKKNYKKCLETGYMYALGRKMADTYINQGIEAGNELMVGAVLAYVVCKGIGLL